MSPTGVLTVAQDARARALITAHPDWPRPGITFLSLFNALADAACLRDLVDALVSRYAPRAKACGAANFYIAGVDARGFTLATAAAYALGVGFVMIRKKGKLPPPCRSEEYGLEYGRDTLELPVAFAAPGGAAKHVVIFDDLLATGGTLCATIDLVQAAGATVVEAAVVMELNGLPGRVRAEAKNVAVHSLLRYDDM